ncbi:MAG: type II toxin-antitoxin system prevent-host-death family antitoxin [Candidatus Bipolaricaulota bacterium]|nr:type II toxin-antitoxin system prevent-host-death family antitoxin [Candidatus Bipolaricaulota bacterium]MCS7274666.1 type II toxin-antitoxin system prevent-host-death family antitoxin [Candidatus Bipolaricaulota bacterium]MDW8111494.1 type II toxin-antitoxin system prevent-host-death family antitoxin [Candidatus Bipolaricaulota bacterium]MDW8329628.1 type II toxin-antitoxin system prevent-host-death family antitoxin [Candidatus Bipolaricaulota bacterium]
MAKVVSIAEAKNKLTQLVREVEAGEQVIITKDRQPAARLIAEAEYEQIERRLAIARLRDLRERWRAAGVRARALAAESRKLLEERP